MGQGGQGYSGWGCVGVCSVCAGGGLEPVLEAGGLSGDLGLFHRLLVEIAAFGAFWANSHRLYHLGAGAAVEKAASVPPEMNEKRQLSSYGAKADFVSCKIFRKHPEGFDRKAGVDYNRKQWCIAFYKWF